MRILGITLFSILLAASGTYAAFTLRSGVYTVNELGQATEAALSERKAVAFLYSDKNTFCTSCSSASLQAMETMMNSCIVVYVDKYGAPKLPEEVKTALRSPRAGKYIPALVVMSYDLKMVIAIVPYARGEAYRKLLLEAQEKIHSYR